MTNYLLDTNHLSPLITIGHPLRQLIFRQATRGDTFSFCLPSLTELIYGISMLTRARENMTEWDKLRPMFICYIPDEQDAELAAELQVSLRKQGWQLETVDATIAITALRYHCVLLTTDKDFRPVPNLGYENWL